VDTDFDDVEGETQLERIQRAHNQYHAPPHHVYELTAEEIQKRQDVLERGTPAERYELLSEMERKVLPLFKLPSNDICSLLNIDGSRLKVCLHGILVKLDVSSRREACDVWRHLSAGLGRLARQRGAELRGTPAPMRKTALVAPDVVKGPQEVHAVRQPLAPLQPHPCKSGAHCYMPRVARVRPMNRGATFNRRRMLMSRH
jgi:hypothetical protein